MLVSKAAVTCHVRYEATRKKRAHGPCNAAPGLWLLGSTQNAGTVQPDPQVMESGRGTRWVWLAPNALTKTLGHHGVQCVLRWRRRCLLVVVIAREPLSNEGVAVDVGSIHGNGRLAVGILRKQHTAYAFNPHRPHGA